MGQAIGFNISPHRVRWQIGMTYGIYSAGISDEQKREIVEKAGLPPCP